MKTIKSTRLFAMTSLICAMTACSTIPQEAQVLTAQPNLPIDTSYEVFDQETISQPEVASLASLRWQEFYADPKLKALIEMGLAYNKDLQNAVLAVQSTKAQYQISDADSFPRIGANFGATRSANGRDVNPSSAFNVGLAMSSYELDLWGKIANAKESALHRYLSSNAAKDTVQISLIANIAQAYVNLSYALAQRQLALETLKTREHSLMITQKRFEAGVDSKSPSLQADASLENAKLAVYQANTGILRARNVLRLLIGAPVPDELMPEMAVNNITTQSLFSTGLPSELLYYRPDIVQAEHDLKSAGANINVARSAYFPSISLSGNLGYSSSSLSDLFGSGTFGWSFGPSINLPIFDAGIRDANYEMAQIAQQRALATYEKAIQTAFKEVDDVLAVRATIGQQLESQYRLQKNYQETYNIAHARFRSGLDDYLSVLDAERSLFANQQGILNLEQQKVLSQIQLYQVLGGGATLSAEPITEATYQMQAMRTAELTDPTPLTPVVYEEEEDKEQIIQPKSSQVLSTSPIPQHTPSQTAEVLQDDKTVQEVVAQDGDKTDAPPAQEESQTEAGEKATESLEEVNTP